MLKDKLEEIGFSDKESKVYLEMLKLGPQAVSIIAKCTKLNRSTTYSVLSSLERKAVVCSYVQNSIKLFAANDPNSLVGYLDRQCRTFAYYRSQLLNIIPKFRLLAQEYNFKKPLVRYLDGIEGVKSILIDCLKARSLLRICFAMSEWLGTSLEEFFDEYFCQLASNPKISMRGLMPDTEKVRVFLKKHQNCLKNANEIMLIRDICGEIFENETVIYDDKVVIVNLVSGHEFAIMIQSNKIAEMHKKLFDMAWKGFDR